MKVLFYVDDSKHWHPAAQAIGDLVRRIGGEVTVLSTIWSGGKRETVFRDAREHLKLPAEQVKTVGHVGLVENVIPDEVKDADYDLVAVGRLGSLDWLTNGLIAHLIVRRSSTNVVIFRGKRQRLRRILVATQGPRHGMENVHAAALIARAFDAEVTVLHVLSQMPVSHHGSEELAEAEDHFMDTDLPEANHLRAAKERLEELGVSVQIKARVGLVVEEIMDEITEETHDLLVLGAHIPRGGREELLYQDVAGLLVRASPIPHLVVREGPPPERIRNVASAGERPPPPG